MEIARIIITMPEELKSAVENEAKICEMTFDELIKSRLSFLLPENIARIKSEMQKDYKEKIDRKEDIRTFTYLDSFQVDRLDDIAIKERSSKAIVIRQAVAQFLEMKSRKRGKAA